MAGRRFLSSHDLTVVASISAALTLLTGNTFDAVLVDFDLDDGKGTDVIAFAGQLPIRPRLVAVSAHDDGNAALQAAGADAVCPKLQFAEIEAVLRSAVGGQEM
jgi:CheY-like chemotaxis protein